MWSCGRHQTAQVRYDVDRWCRQSATLLGIVMLVIFHEIFINNHNDWGLRKVSVWMKSTVSPDGVDEHCGIYNTLAACTHTHNRIMRWNWDA